MKLSILIVDDSDVDRYILKRQLEDISSDLKWFEAENGDEALKFLEAGEENTKAHGDAFPPALILLDVNMPVLNGWEFLDQFSLLKERINLSSCVVMMFTSSEHKTDITHAENYDFVKGYIIKGSLGPDELELKIKQTLAL